MSAPLIHSGAGMTLTPDLPIDQIWQDRCTTFRAFENAPPMEDESAIAYWDRRNEAEVAILASPDTSARAAEIRLWVAWSHYDETDRTEVWLGDAAALLPIRDDLDWNEKLLFAAILNLRGEG